MRPKDKPGVDCASWLDGLEKRNAAVSMLYKPGALMYPVTSGAVKNLWAAEAESVGGALGRMLAIYMDDEDDGQ